RDRNVTGVQTCALPIYVAADRLGVGEHAPGRRHQGLTGRGQRDVAARAVEELGAELLLQRRDLAAQRRLGQMQGGGGLREMAGGGDLDEAGQLFEIHADSIPLSTSVEQCIGRMY